MKKLIFICVVFASCGPVPNQNQKPVNYIVQSEYGVDNVYGEIKKLPDGCISYETDVCCGNGPATVTICGTYKVTKQTQ